MITYYPGDVVVCKMPSTLRNYDLIEESHRERPYVLMKPSSDGISFEAYPITSNLDRGLPDNQKVLLKRGWFNLSKDSAIILTESHHLIPNQHFLYKIGSIDDDLKKVIDNYVLINRYYSNSNDNHPMFENINLKAGDIIDYGGKWYFVYEQKGNKISCFPLAKSYHPIYAQTSVNIPNNKHRFVYVRRAISISKSDSNYKIVFRTSSKILKKVKSNKKSCKPHAHLNHSSYNLNFPTGSILQTRDNDYFVYLFTTKNIYCGIQLTNYQENNFYIQQISDDHVLRGVIPKKDVIVNIDKWKGKGFIQTAIFDYMSIEHISNTGDLIQA